MVGALVGALVGSGVGALVGALLVITFPVGVSTKPVVGATVVGCDDTGALVAVVGLLGVVTSGESVAGGRLDAGKSVVVGLPVVPPSTMVVGVGILVAALLNPSSSSVGTLLVDGGSVAGATLVGTKVLGGKVLIVSSGITPKDGSCGTTGA